MQKVLRAFPAAAVLFGFGCVEQTDDKPTEEDLKVIKQNILATAPTPKNPVNADLEGKLLYIGSDVETVPIEPGKDVKITHYWKVVSPPGEGWKIFTHLSGPNKQGFINVDHVPIRGKYAVARWKAGEIIRDEHSIRLPGTWQHSKVDIYTGAWKGPNRMQVKSGPHDGENRVLAASVPTQVKIVVPRKRYVARKATKPPKIDGKLDDEAWKDVLTTGPFVNTLTGAPVEQRTEARLLWDDKFLYIGVDAADADAWSNLAKRDDKLWTQEAIEVMIDGDGDGKSYIELQVAPNGTVFDTYLPEYRKYEDSVDPKRKQFDWNSGMKVAVKVDGTLNKREDQDKGWSVELAIPLEDVKGLATTGGPKIPPATGDVWRFNLFRLDMPQGQAQQASAWSPPMVGDFHVLDKFGDLVFGDDKGVVAHPPVGSAPALPRLPLGQLNPGIPPRPNPGIGLSVQDDSQRPVNEMPVAPPGYKAPAAAKAPASAPDGEKKKK